MLLRNGRKAGIAAGIAMIGPLLGPGLLSAQSCALCYTQAASAGSRMIEALRSGILVLVVPPMLISLGIAWMAYKKRNQFDDEQALEAQDTPRDDR